MRAKQNADSLYTKGEESGISQGKEQMKKAVLKKLREEIDHFNLTSREAEALVFQNAIELIEEIPNE